MEPSIIFLGTAGDTVVVSKQIRGSGGIILRVDGLQFHIDPGPGSLPMAKMWGVNPRETNVILVTHNHLTHSGDLNAVIHAMTLNGFDTKGVLVAPSSVVDGGEGQTPALSTYYRKMLEKILVVTAEKRIGIESVDILPIETKHTDTHAVGYKIMTTRFTLGYSGDTMYSKDLIEAFSGCDILILNTVFPRGAERESENLSVDDAAKIIEGVKPTLCIITHFGKKMLDADPMQEARDLQIMTGSQVIAARDGLVINPYSYSAESRQKSLKAFQTR